MTDKPRDLFEFYEEQPPEVAAAVALFDEDGQLYDECKALQARLEPLGYSIEWGLSGEPFNLFKVPSFKELVFELAFGDEAINKDYSEDEVLAKLREFSDKAFMWDGDEGNGE